MRPRRWPRWVGTLLVSASLSGVSQGYQPFQGETVWRLRRPRGNDPCDTQGGGGSGDGSSSFRCDPSSPLSAYQYVPSDVDIVHVDRWIRSRERSLVAFGTYAGDFNTFEYAQGLRYHLETLRRECRIDQFALVVNTTPAGGRLVADLLDLPEDVEVWVDNAGSLARRVHVGRGWLPDAAMVPPWVKLVGMMPWGLGAPGTLPAIVEGYVGVPPGEGRSRQTYAWVQDALAVGQRHGRWPNSILELDPTTTTNETAVLRSKFDDFGLGTGSWPLRPFEKATLRLQTLLGVTMRHWNDVMPNDEAMRNGVLTQLGGCLVFHEFGTTLAFEGRDTGCCAIVSFEDMIRAADNSRLS